MNIHRLILALCLTVAFPSAQAQEKINIENACNYFGEKSLSTTSVIVFPADSLTEQMIQKIVEAYGLSPNFIVKAAGVKDALATIEQGQRYILYNQLFVRELLGKTQSDWAAVAVLAHEIAHHLNGHTLDKSGSRPDTEIEADKAAGQILQKMGATLEQASLALKLLGDDKGSATHPPKADRIAAMASGWIKSEETNGKKPAHELALTPVKSAVTETSAESKGVIATGTLTVIPAAEWTEPVTGIQFVWVKPGCFQTGSQGNEAERNNDELQHNLCLEQGYYLGKTEVTQAQWQKIMGTNPSGFKGESLPVENVSWDAAQAFIGQLKSQNPGKQFSLPTEAQWEYACRSGGKDQTYCGGEDVDSLAWYSGNADKKTHPVATKAANGLGLFDMSGNVWEWVGNWYDDYSSAAITNLTGSAMSSSRVVRGGSWVDDGGGFPRSARHYWFVPASRYDFHIGFRLALGQIAG